MRPQISCFGCGSSETTPVFEHNGLVLLEYMRESPMARYEYSLCGRCGLVSASRRPDRDDLGFLYSRFDEFLGRTEVTSERVEDADVINREAILQQVNTGWLVSEETPISPAGWLEEVLHFRVAESYHADIITSLVDLQGARILELRALDARMLHVFRERYGARDVIAMPMSERHRVVIEELYGIPTAVVDFDEMTLPPGSFDLVIARHMVTHALNSDLFWTALSSAVAPGGALYLYLENDDSVMFSKRKNLFGEMKCFHFQSFDLPCLARLLRLHGFEPTFIRHPRAGKSEMVCLARRQSATFEAITPAALAQRRQMYSDWRALSILSAPGSVRKLFARGLDDLHRQVTEAGYVTKNREGRSVPVKLRLMHEDGYTRLNERAAEEEK